MEIIEKGKKERGAEKRKPEERKPARRKRRKRKKEESTVAKKDLERDLRGRQTRPSSLL